MTELDSLKTEVKNNMFLHLTIILFLLDLKFVIYKIYVGMIDLREMLDMVGTLYEMQGIPKVGIY